MSHDAPRSINSAALITAQRPFVGMTSMKTKLLGLMALVMQLGMSQAGAATLVGSTSDATGIDGLVVDGITYNVTFVITSYGSPTFLGDPMGSQAAAAAIVSVLNFYDVTKLALTGPDNVGGQLAFVPYLNNAVSGQEGYAADCPGETCITTWASTLLGVPFPTFPPPTNLVYTDFTASTPLPAALSLFTSGLGVIGALSWRRKQNRRAASGPIGLCKTDKGSTATRLSFFARLHYTNRRNPPSPSWPTGASA